MEHQPGADAFKVTLHMVSGVDGVIAKKDNSIAWFNTTSHYGPGVTLTDTETHNFLQAIDCYVMGARTYEHALELSKTYGWAYGDTPVIVLSHRELPVERPNIEIYSGDLNHLVNQRLKPLYKQVWVAGGAMVCKEFLLLNLADELRLSIMPIILGEGTQFLNQIGAEQPLHLKNVTAYKTGMVELVYTIPK